MAGGFTTQLMWEMGSRLWMETGSIIRNSVLDNNTKIDNWALQKPGRFVCGIVSLDHNLTIAQADGVSAVMRNQDASELTPGSFIKNFEICEYNSNASTLAVGYTLLVFLRGTGK